VKHSCRQNFVVSSVKLCQVGIERRHRVLREELCCEFKRSRITEDSESSARWASSGCIRAQEDRTAGGSEERRNSARWALRLCAGTDKGEENSLSSAT
jgi:hypothetical protein